MKSNTTNSASAGLLVAFTASLCCITPVLALFSGIGGVAATFSWMEPFRPYLIGATVLVLGFAWYQKLKPRTQEEIECDCEEDGKEPFIQSKKFLGIVTVAAIILLSFPSYSHIFYPTINNKEVSQANESILKLVDMEIEGMTCTGCEDHVKFAASQLEGVFTTDANFETGKAAITIDQSISSVEELVAAINETGYTVVQYKVTEADPELLKSEKETDFPQ